MFIIELGVILLVRNNIAFKDNAGALLSGNNMAAIHLANKVGGNFSSTSAVAFATILTGGGDGVKARNATGHDELLLSKITVVVLGFVATGLSMLFEHQNIAFMVGLAFYIAARCNFPIILLSMY